ncbi:hypothetical protein Cni_G02395 [Canna indica]|uniref:Uncharacterized protein n=1 Tax=Canna indica TaxID=4628 RepID=A0AAQ3JSH3_9LILI|nr:hypothetical protein Cni_G02395 [Canna indica]
MALSQGRSTVLVVFLLSLLFHQSTARLLGGKRPSLDGVGFSEETFVVDRTAKKDASYDITSPPFPRHPCGGGARTKQKEAERYGRLFLAMLPRGKPTPSGPSGGINGSKN